MSKAVSPFNSKPDVVAPTISLFPPIDEACAIPLEQNVQLPENRETSSPIPSILNVHLPGFLTISSGIYHLLRHLATF